VLKIFQALCDRTDVRPGCVVSLQTRGAYGANFNPHAYALASDCVFTRQGEFLPLPSLDPAAVMGKSGTSHTLTYFCRIHGIG
jgi:hypothetical protein